MSSELEHVDCAAQQDLRLPGVARTEVCGSYSARWAPRGSSNGAAVFWFLFVLGVVTFAPCIIVPEWRNYQVAKVAEQREKHRLDKLRQVVASERRQVEAIQNDPTVVARLAQRDLGFLRPGEKIVAVDVGDSHQFAGMADLDEDYFVPAPVLPPSWFTRATWWLPDFNYDAIFCDPSTRPIVMLMSISVIVVAVALFHRPTPARA